MNRGLILAKTSVKEKFFDLTFTDVHMGCQKVPKSDFKIIQSLFFIEEYQFRRRFFVIVIF